MTSPDERRHDSAELRQSRAAWTALVREAKALLAVDPDDMTVEERERLESLTDWMFGVVGYSQRLTPSSVAYRDPRLVGQLAQQARIDRRATGDRGAPGRKRLRQRILAGLHGDRCGVRTGDRPLPVRMLPSPRAIGAELLADAERVHSAVVVPELSVAAGAGRALWDAECEALVEVPRNFPHGRYLALRVSGDSMEPLLTSGDSVLVRLDSIAEPGTVVVARVPEHGYVVKEVGRIDDGGIELRSLNPDFAPLRVPHASGTVLGTVVMRWRASAGSAGEPPR